MLRQAKHKSYLRVAAKAAAITFSAIVLVSALSNSASAGWDRDDHHRADHRDDHRWDHHGWNGGYYRSPPVVYSGPYNNGYYPPPVVYSPGPSIGIALPGVSIGFH